MKLEVEIKADKTSLHIKDQSYEFEQFFALFSGSKKEELALIQLDSSYEICVAPMSSQHKRIKLSIYDILQRKVCRQVFVGKRQWSDFADALLHIRYRSLGTLDLWSTYQGFSIGTPLLVRFTRQSYLWGLQKS